MKAILVIDVGANVDFKKDFAKIRLFTSNGRGISYYNKVKLQPMPNEKEEKEYVDYYDMGWNDCVRVLNNNYNLCKLG